MDLPPGGGGIPAGGSLQAVAAPGNGRPTSWSLANAYWGGEPWGGVASIVAGQERAMQLPLSLAVWVDHSVVEAFAMGGRGRVASRMYPLTEDVAWGVAVWGKCALADVYALTDVHRIDSAMTP